MEGNDTMPLLAAGRAVRRRAWLIIMTVLVIFLLWSKRHKLQDQNQKQVESYDYGQAGEEGLFVEGKRVTDDWMEVSEKAVLPPGLDIEVDMTTHRRRVRLHQQTASEHNSLLPVEQPGNEDEFKDPLNKMGRVYAAHRSYVDEQLEALGEPGQRREEALAYLEGECRNVNIGAGMLRSPALGKLMALLSEQTSVAVRAADILFGACHNNPSAVAWCHRTPLIKHLLARMGVEKDAQVMKRMLGTLAAIFRLDGEHAPHQFMSIGLSGLEAAAGKFIKQGEVIDRVLTTLEALLEVGKLNGQEHRQIAELVDRLLERTGVQGHADWMEHAFKPLCSRWPEAIKGLSHFNSLCLYLTSK